MTTNGGTQWQAVSGFENANMYGVAFSPSGGTVYASNFTNIYVSTDSGSTWTFAGPAPCAAANLAVSPTTPTTAYLGSSCAAQSFDGGQTWNTLNIPAYSFNAVAINPQSPSTVYMGTSSGLYESTDGGQSWNPLNVAGLQYPNVTAIAINPATSADVYTVANGSVYGSTNSGAVWSPMSTGISVSVNTIAIAASKPASLYAGTSAGVYSTTNSASSWKSAGETGNNISLVVVDPLQPGTVFAGTSANSDAFAAKINSSGSKLLYSTYLGGSGIDYALGIAVTSSGNAYVTGSVQSPDFPTTKGVLQSATGLMRSTAFVSSIQTKTPSCTYTASPASGFFYAAGGTGNFSVVAPSGCKWTTNHDILMDHHQQSRRAGNRHTGNQRRKEYKRRAHRIDRDRDRYAEYHSDGFQLQLLDQRDRAYVPGNRRRAERQRQGWVRMQVGSHGLPLWLTITSGASGTGNGTVALDAAPNPFPYSRGGFPTIANIQIGTSENGTAQ